MTLEWPFAWMMVGLRAGGVVFQLPMIGGRSIPVMVRLALALCLATLLVGVVPAAAPPLVGWQLALAAARETLVGLLLGFVVRMTFAAVEMAGRLISTEIGLMATPGMGVPEPSTEPLAAFLSAFAVVLFFALGGQHAVLSAFARSFQVAPAGAARLPAAGAAALTADSAQLIELAFRMAAPFIAMNFLITLAFSALSRAVPKMQVFIIGFSARALVGLALLGSAGALIARYLYTEFTDLPWRMLQAVAGH